MRTLLGLLLLLTLAAPAWATAPLLDDDEGWTSSVTVTTTETCTITPTASALVAVVANTITSSRDWDTPTSAGLSFTQYGNITDGGSTRRLKAWYANNVSAGAHTITVTVSGGNSAATYIHCYSLTGVHTSAPLTATNAGFEDTNASTSHVCDSSGRAYGTDVYTTASGSLTSWSNTVTEGADVAWTKLSQFDTQSAGAGSFELITQGFRSNGTSLTSTSPWSSDVARSSICITSSWAAAAGGGGGGGAAPGTSILLTGVGR